MPVWHKKVLLLGVVLAIVGFGGQVMGYFAGSVSSPSTRRETSSANVPNSANAFDTRTARPSETDAEPSTPWWQKLSPRATKIGVSLVIGFFVGFLFRAFLKTMAMVTAVIVAILLALSYFNVLNIDFTAAREHYQSAAHWLSDQAWRLKDAIVAHIPSGAAGVFGAFMGMRRH
jgi:uncharacterized membrane protein (Fun14 family)